jgi:hypothetical protein
VILAVVAIAALALAGMGGLFADFSDIEISEENYFKTGSMDLTVSNDAGVEYNGDIIPAVYEVSDAWPCCDKSVFFDLENWGQGTQRRPYAYVHFKNFECGWVMPKYADEVPASQPIWIDCEDGECVIVDPPDPLPSPGTQGTGLPKPVTEPEYVAECGGIAGEDEDGNPVEVEGIGCCYGEDCELSEHIGVLMWVAGPWPHEDKPPTAAEVPTDDWEPVPLPDPNGDGVTKLNEIECEQIFLDQIANCNGIWVHVSLHFQDFDEEVAYDEGLIPETYFDETYPEFKWDHWPTNAMMKDALHFDIAFELLQNKVP